MKRRIALGCVILLFLVSCAGTGTVSTGDGISSGGFPESVVVTGGPSSAGGDGASYGAGPGGNYGRAKSGTPDDEDSITSLLEHDDFKDFDLPIVFNDAVKYYIVYFTTEKKRVFANWLKRSRRYVPMIREILREHGLPEDLVYLAMIESGFNPKAYSTAKACGPWQFIYATGGRYGLKVDFWIDERRDPEKSTVAAAKYLTDLFNQFGCWYLAAAGYNAGEGRVEKAIEKHNTNDFWELAKYNALPGETREYIPKLIAASIIAKDPERFGFGSITYEEPMRFVEMKVPRATSLAAIARASSISLKELRSLNPEIVRGITPPYTDDYRIKLLSSIDVMQVSEDLQAELAKGRRIKGVITYKVRKRDTLAKILKRYGVREEEMYLVNNCDARLKIRRGMVLNIPRFSPSSRGHTAMRAKADSSSEPSRTRTNSNSKAKMTSRRPGGGPEGVLTAHQGTDDAGNEESALIENRNKTAKLEKRSVPARGRSGAAPKTEAGQKEEGSRAKKTYHIVKKGETLSGISSKYGVQMASLISLNNLKSKTVYPNMKLRLVSHHSQKRKGRSGTVKFHTVKKGENLTQIAKRYGVSVASLKSANKLKSGKITARMRLKIVDREG